MKEIERFVNLRHAINDILWELSELENDHTRGNDFDQLWNHLESARNAAHRLEMTLLSQEFSGLRKRSKK